MAQPVPAHITHSLAPPVMKGYLNKRGSFRRNWKRRFFVLERGRIVYFEPEHWLQMGERNLHNFQIVAYKQPSDLYIYLSPPKGGTALVLRTATSSERGLWIASLNAHINFANLLRNNPLLLVSVVSAMRQKAQEEIPPQVEPSRTTVTGISSAALPVEPPTRIGDDVLTTISIEEKKEDLDLDEYNELEKLRSLSTFTSIEDARRNANLPACEEIYQDEHLDPIEHDEGLEEPPVVKGWMIKQGQLVKSWKQRYFILHSGILTYYRVKNEGGPPYKKEKMGELSLWDYEVVCESKFGDEETRSVDDTSISAFGKLILKPLETNRFGRRRVLILAIDLEVDWMMWSAALELHIGFATAIESGKLKGNPAAADSNYSDRPLSSVWNAIRKFSVSQPSAANAMSPRTHDDVNDSFGHLQAKETRNSDLPVERRRSWAPNSSIQFTPGRSGRGSYLEEGLSQAVGSSSHSSRVGRSNSSITSSTSMSNDKASSTHPLFLAYSGFQGESNATATTISSSIQNQQKRSGVSMSLRMESVQPQSPISTHRSLSVQQARQSTVVDSLMSASGSYDSKVSRIIETGGKTFQGKLDTLAPVLDDHFSTSPPISDMNALMNRDTLVRVDDSESRDDLLCSIGEEAEAEAENGFWEHEGEDVGGDELFSFDIGDHDLVLLPGDYEDRSSIAMS